MQRFGLISRITAVAMGVLLAVAALATASAQPAQVPHFFYGTDGTPGDVVGLVDDMGNEVGSATVDENGEWSISAEVDAETVSFTLNGKSADAATTDRGETQTEVSVTAMAMEEDTSMEEGDAMEGDELAGDDDSMEELEGEEGDSMESDSMEGDSMEGDDDKMTEYPETGTGGLADGSGVSAGLIGLLIALGVAAAAGLGLRRVRNRA